MEWMCFVIFIICKENIMFLVCIFVLCGKFCSYCCVIVDNIYEVLCESFNVFEEDCFMVIIEYDLEDLVFSCSYMGMVCMDDFVFI